MVSDKLPISSQPSTDISNAPALRLPLHRPPLRAKTGCLKCRKRRKKCDELKPVCGDCARLRFACVWPDAGAAHSATSSQASASRQEKRTHSASSTHVDVDGASDEPHEAVRTSVVALTSKSISASTKTSQSSTALTLKESKSVNLKPKQTLQIKHTQSAAFTVPVSWSNATSLCRHISSGPRARNDVESDLLVKAPQIIDLLICPTAELACHDFSVVLQIARGETWIQNSMLAFAASVMASTSPTGDLSLEASRLYQTAVAGLRQNIVESISLRKQQMLLVAVNFLGLLETLTSVEPDRPMVHFVAAAKLLSTIRHKMRLDSDWNMSSSTNTFYRVMAEDALYNIACLAIFQPDLDHLARNINWVDIESFFPAFQTRDGSFTTSNYKTSPFLGGRRDIYYLMFDVLHFARQEGNAQNGQQRIKRFRNQLQYIEEGISSYYDNDVPAEVGAKYSDKYKLHAVCLRIIIAKIEDTRRCSSSPLIARHVAECLAIMKERELLENLNPALCWTMQILACAANTDEEFDVIKTFSIQLRSIIDKGHGDRMMTILDMCQRLRDGGPGKCSRGADGTCLLAHDGLGMLMKKKGVFE